MMRNFGGATMLVCGGAGFIGSNFVRQALAGSPKLKVVCLDALTYAGNKDNLRGLSKNRFAFIKGDIRDAKLVERIFARYKPSYVINFAAESHVDRSIHGGALDFFRTNVEGAAVLFEAARKLRDLKKFVQVSTDEVYGALSLGTKQKFTEKSPLAPNSPYAASKAAADIIGHAYYVTYGLPLVITRCSNNYGHYQHPEKLIPYSITRLMAGKPIAIYGDGKYVRDWIHVDDHADALLLALLKGKPGEMYNVGAEEEVDNLTLAKRILAHFKKDSSDIVFVKDRPGHDRRYAIDASKIRKELDWKPQHAFKDSFASTIAWYVGHAEWMRRALRRAGTANTHI